MLEVSLGKLLRWGKKEGLENTSWMKSDPVCHENEKALKDHCVFGKLAIFHESNKKMSTVVEWHWKKYG